MNFCIAERDRTCPFHTIGHSFAWRRTQSCGGPEEFWHEPDARGATYADHQGCAHAIQVRKEHSLSRSIA